MTAAVNVIATVLQPSPDICIPGVQILDTGLKWYARVRNAKK